MKYYQNVLCAMPKKLKLSILTKQFITVMCAITILGISANVYIPLIPVPLSLQSLSVLLVGIMLDKKLSMISILLYIALGLIGLPMFAEGTSGLNVLFAPSFGYIVGFVVATYILGIANSKIQQGNFSFIKYFVYLLIAHQTICVVGVIYLSVVLGSLKAGFLYGYLPFIGWDLLKIALATNISWLFNRTINK